MEVTSKSLTGRMLRCPGCGNEVTATFRVALSQLESASTGAQEASGKLAAELELLAERVDRELRAEIRRAADDAKAAEGLARAAVEAIHVFQDLLGGLRRSVDEAGGLERKMDTIGLDVAELRRQMRDHIDHHS